MKEVKRRFKYFKYRECDAFAKYLEEQAAKGWHFKEWRLGLVHCSYARKVKSALKGSRLVEKRWQYERSQTKVQIF